MPNAHPAARHAGHSDSSDDASGSSGSDSDSSSDGGGGQKGGGQKGGQKRSLPCILSPWCLGFGFSLPLFFLVIFALVIDQKMYQIIIVMKKDGAVEDDFGDLDDY